MEKQKIQVLEKNGFTIIPAIIDTDQINKLISVVEPVLRDCPSAGIRNIVQKQPLIQALSESPQIMVLVNSILGVDAKLVRSIFFNKDSNINWAVSWHQDLSIAVRQKADISGFYAWSKKDGILHVQPPTSIMEKMLTIRIHLDNTDESNGVLRVSPGSHQLGRIAANQTTIVAKKRGEIACNVVAGDALLFRPLLLHCSGKTRSSSRPRRIIHLEYSSARLPSPLQWHEGAYD